MTRPRSRVAQEAWETAQQKLELQRKIKQLSVQVSNPQKYFGNHSHQLAQSPMRYFTLGRASAKVEKRKPTRAETRAQRNRAIVCSIIACIIIFWLFGKILQTFR